jgi:hypothetical protein
LNLQDQESDQHCRTNLPKKHSSTNHFLFLKQTFEQAFFTGVGRAWYSDSSYSRCNEEIVTGDGAVVLLQLVQGSQCLQRDERLGWQ